MSRAIDPLIRFCSDAVVLHDSGSLLQEMPDDASAMLEVAKREGMTGLLANALAGMPGDVPEALRKAAQVEAMHELARLAKARQALEALIGAGIPVLVLKGTALAYWLYASPLHRPRCDLDILVPDIASAERVVALLESVDFRLVAGMAPSDAPGYEVALEHTGSLGQAYAVDLHWRLSNSASLARGFEFAELQESSIPVPVLHVGARGLGRIHALVHALLHRVSNFPSGKQDRLIWLYDMHLLAGGYDSGDWQSFVALCRAKTIATPCLDGLRACHAMFGTAIPNEVESELQSLSTDEPWRLDTLILDQGTMDRAHVEALSWRDKLGWLRRKLFPSPEFMRYRYEIDGVAELAQAYLLRWWVGFMRVLGR